MAIPKRILQIALGDEYISQCPLKLIKRNILSLNEGYEYVLLTDKECKEFLETYYSSFIDVYNSLVRYQHKLDLVRYLYIYHYGGFYVDIDLLPSVSYDYINYNIQDATSFYTIGAHHNGKLEMANGFFGSVANNKLLYELAQKMYLSHDYAVNIKQMYTTLLNTYGLVEPFTKVENAYYLKECRIGDKYHIFINEEKHVCFSNANNYPPKVFITYNNKHHPDGAGAQIQRMILLYLTAKKFKLGYIHTPIEKSTYQGLQCLVNNKNDNTQIIEYNKLISLESESDSIKCSEEHEVVNLNHNVMNQLLNTKFNHNVLIKCAYCTLADEGMSDLLDIKIPFNWIDKHLYNPLIIAIHIRRGELFVVDSQRMLPNSYYIEVIQALIDILGERPYELHIHTENVTEEVIITPTHHGIMNRINNNITLSPSDNKFEEFNSFNKLTFHINEDPIKTFKDLTNADILIASRSSFSYTASILKSKGVVLFHPFWHRLSQNWIHVTNKNDVIKNKELILSKITVV